MSITGPIAPYSNVPINAAYYKPSRFQISAITLGKTTDVTTTAALNYVVGQQVRVLLSKAYGCQQLNNLSAYVVVVPSTTKVTLDVDSNLFDPFIASPFSATVTNATQATNCVLTATSNFVAGQTISISSIEGMTELNGNTYQIISSTETTITLDVNSSSFTAYSASGTASSTNTYNPLPQIVSIGNINSGQSQNSDINSLLTYIPGSFINIS